MRLCCRVLVFAFALSAGGSSSLLSQSVIRPWFDETSLHRGLFPHKTPVRPRVALVLSGGGARGIAQIGVLKALERHSIPVDFIVATSLGAVVGGLYASGYTPAKLETLVLSTNWDELLSLSDETRRRDLFIDQKLADDRSFLAVRFEGFDPVIPSAVSSGQRLTDFLITHTLQAPYHSDASFDDLKIRFRSVTTDLISGRRIVLGGGSLAEALRASTTVPLLFSPVEKDSMQLIDGGLVSNIPVDIARSEGYDIVIVVNSTSSLRNRDELKAPWEKADQIMGIMMQASNEQQLKAADVVITPEIGRHLSSDFSGLDSLILLGELAAEKEVAAIQSLYDRKYTELLAGKDREEGYFASLSSDGDSHLQFAGSVTLHLTGSDITDSLRRTLPLPRSFGDIRRQTHEIFAEGVFSDVAAEVATTPESTHVVYRVTMNPEVAQVRIRGCKLLGEEVVSEQLSSLVGKPLNPHQLDAALEHVLDLYRSNGYSLARIDSVAFHREDGVLDLRIDEGIIGRIDVQGGVRTQDYFVLREFPLEAGGVFEIDRANAGVVNINSTKLFDYVYLELSYPGNIPTVTIRLKERPSQLVRFGVRADDERNLQGSLDIRDENFHGTGAQLGFTISGGARNKEVAVEYRAIRVFDSYFTFNVSAFHSLFDTYVYGDVSGLGPSHFDRERLGEYRDIRTGARLMFGSQLERLGNATVEFSVQRARIKSIENMESLAEQYLLTLLKIGTVIDSKDAYPFASYGVGLNLSYEISSARLGSDFGYNALNFLYESYSTWGGRHTLHPKVTLRVADRTMPLGQQFRLGGRDLFFGLHEDDRRGRQLLLFSLEYRYHFPIRVLFDTYLRFRYDLGSISSNPEEFKFSTFMHGLGAELALDTPVGPALFGVGKSFHFVRNLPENPVQQGPFLLYFMIGYQLLF